MAFGARSVKGGAVGDAGGCGADGAGFGVPTALGMAVPRSEPRGDEVPVGAVGWGGRAPSVGPAVVGDTTGEVGIGDSVVTAGAAGAGGEVTEGATEACGEGGAKV